MSRILRTHQADADISSIWNYIAQDNITAADKVLDEVIESFELLASSPDIGIPQFQYREGLRCKPVAKKYLIFYETTDEGICILRVLHGAHDWPHLLQ